MHRFYAPDARPPFVDLPPDEGHHLARVLRVGPADEVIVFDGTGGEWRGRVAAVQRGRVRIDLIEARVPLAEPPVPVTLAASLLKGLHMDHVVRDATMLGAAAIVPLVSAHVVAPDRGRCDRARERWQRIAVASAKQCGRSIVPPVEPCTTLVELLARADWPERFVCVEPGHDAAPEPGPEPCEDMASGTAPRPARALLGIGPEGGWSSDEISAWRRAGGRCLSLGPRVLRAETSPTVALTSLWTWWGWT